jgi:flagellar basal-body rod modification protein FlgD
MTITVDTKASSQLAAQNAVSNSATSSEDIQNRFLTLLVAQLENQDPLNPLDNAEITNQMAQMSTVSGIEQLNSTLSYLVNSLADTQAVQASALINKTVLVPGSNINLVNGEAFGGVYLSGPADSVTIKILDASGNLVQTQSLGATEAGSMLFSWDGLNSAGTPVADGSYTFSATASNESAAVSAQAMQLGMVSALTRTVNGNFVLDLGSLGQFDFADVQQVF